VRSRRFIYIYIYPRCAREARTLLAIRRSTLLPARYTYVLYPRCAREACLGSAWLGAVRTRLAYAHAALVILALGAHIF